MNGKKLANQLTNGQLVDVVLAARDRIAVAWTKGARARKARPSPTAFDGACTRPTDPEAVEWCMAGALMAEAPRGWRHRGIRDVVQIAFDEAGILKWACGATASPNSPAQKIESFNDSHGQEKAVGAFDELARWLKDTGWEPPVDEFVPLDDRSGINEH